MEIKINLLIYVPMLFLIDETSYAWSWVEIGPQGCGC